MNHEKQARVYQVTAMEERRVVPETRRGTSAVYKAHASHEALGQTMSRLEADEHFHILTQRIETFAAETQMELGCLREAIAAADAEAICETARRLTDHTGRMGAMKMMRLCIALQMLGRRDMVAKAQEIAVDLEREFLELKRTLVRAS